jgi:hypothetical protein
MDDNDDKGKKGAAFLASNGGVGGWKLAEGTKYSPPVMKMYG